MKRFFLILFFITTLFSISASPKKTELKHENWNTNYTYVFVHGLSGWGHYDKQNKFFPYWGMRNGSLLKELKKQGFEVYDASVAPQGSAWDRACELYAQLTGSVTDYGVEHSTRCGHPRFGKDFSKDPLIKKWDSENKINILGHSFGGVTIRLLAHLMAYGAPEEIAATQPEYLSPLFKGGHEDWIYSITTLAAPHNGTSAYHIKDPVPQKKSFSQKMMNKINNKKTDNRADFDVAAFDMHIENAAKINVWLKTLPNTYYFSFSANATNPDEYGNYVPDDKKMETLFQRSSVLMGSFEGITEDGIQLNSDWKMNDGLVNTVSAMAPDFAPKKEFNVKSISPGIWNIMPIYYGDHMVFQGGLNIKTDMTDFYIEHLNLINNL